jgi:hypothetical protein
MTVTLTEALPVAGNAVVSTLSTVAVRVLLYLTEHWPAAPHASDMNQGLTLVHFSAQRERFLWDRGRM